MPAAQLPVSGLARACALTPQSEAAPWSDLGKEPHHLGVLHPVAAENVVQRASACADHVILQAAEKNARRIQWQMSIFVDHIKTERVDNEQTQVSLIGSAHDGLIYVRISETIANHHQS